MAAESLRILLLRGVFDRPADLAEAERLYAALWAYRQLAAELHAEVDAELSAADPRGRAARDQ